MHHHRLERFLIFIDFSDNVVGGVNECGLGVLYNEVRHLEDLLNPVNQNFLNI